MRTWFAPCLASTIALLVMGCGDSGTNGSPITGSVTYKGKRVTGGTMLFHNSGRVFPAALGPDGQYSATVPRGEYTVTLDTKGLKDVVDAAATMRKMAAAHGQDSSGHKAPDSPKSDKGNAPRYVPIPNKYADVKTSTIKVMVEGGASKDFELTD